MMRIIEVMKIRRYLALAVAIAFVFSAFYVYTQVLGITENLDVWLANVPHLNAALLAIFAGLFGVTMSYQIYVWKQPKACATGQKAKSGGATGAATFIGLLVAQCPACASIGALFLPVSAIAFIGQFGILLNLISIGLLVFTINYLGGFRKA